MYRPILSEIMRLCIRGTVSSFQMTWAMEVGYSTYLLSESSALVLSSSRSKRGLRCRARAGSGNDGPLPELYYDGRTGEIWGS